MSLSAIIQAWKTECPSHTTKLVLLAIADYAGAGGVAWPSISTLAEKCQLSRQGVVDQLGKLEKSGIISRRKGVRRSTEYTILASQRDGLLVNEVDQTSQRGGLALVNVVDQTSQAGRLEPQGNHKKEPIKNPKGESDPEFNKFWQSYPRKVAKVAAIKAWRKSAKNRPPTEKLIAIVEKLKITRQWTASNGQYIPYPGSWLNGEGWADEIETKASRPKSLAERIIPD